MIEEAAKCHPRHRGTAEETIAFRILKIRAPHWSFHTTFTQNLRIPRFNVIEVEATALRQ